MCFTVITEHLVKDIDTVKAFKPLLKVAQVKSVVQVRRAKLNVFLLNIIYLYFQQVKNETERLQMFADSGPLLCPSGNMFV